MATKESGIRVISEFTEEIPLNSMILVQRDPDGKVYAIGINFVDDKEKDQKVFDLLFSLVRCEKWPT